MMPPEDAQLSRPDTAAHDHLITWVKIVAVVAGFLWLLCVGAGVVCIANGWEDKAASFGDLFGAINAAFASVAAVGAVYAVLLQREALELQRIELHETREEMKRQTDIHDANLDIIRDETKERRRLAELSVAPHLMLRWVHCSNANGTISIHNAGALIFDLEVTNQSHSRTLFHVFELDSDLVLEKPAPVKLRFTTNAFQDAGDEITFVLHYRNIRDERCKVLLGIRVLSV